MTEIVTIYLKSKINKLNIYHKQEMLIMLSDRVVFWTHSFFLFTLMSCLGKRLAYIQHFNCVTKTKICLAIDCNL